MDPSDDLIQNVYTYFLKAYRQDAAGAAQNELVAFENIGFAPGCSALTGNNVAAAALEEVSHFSDELPRVVGGAYTHTMRTISATYGTMLDAAEPSSAAPLVTFTDLKAHAQKAYQGTLGSFDGPTPYLPTYPTPSDWYDLGNAANWQSYSYEASVKTPAPGAPAPEAQNVRMQWRIVPQKMRPLIFQPRKQMESVSNQAVEIRAAEPVAQVMPMHTRLAPNQEVRIQAAEPAAQVMPMRTWLAPNQEVRIQAAEPTAQVMPMLTRLVVDQVPATHVAEPAAASAQVLPVTPIHMIQLTGLASVARLATQTQSQPVETPKFTMSFDYCVVRLRRPWLSGDFLAMSGWYVPGAHRGDYASGPPDNAGPFAVIPTAFIAVKNLAIEANWSESDVAARANAASFGPFSLLGPSTDDKNSVRNSGVQIIAWICSVQPQLPPDTDPSLVTATATTPPNVPSDSGSPTQPASGSSGPTAGSGPAVNTSQPTPTSSNAGTGSSGTSSAPADGNASATDQSHSL